MPVLGEGGVVENLSLKSKPAESAIRQMPTRLFHQASFTGDSAQIAYQQKAQENFRVNRGTANGTVCISQPFPDESEIDKAIEAFPGDDHLGSDLPTESNKNSESVRGCWPIIGGVPPCRPRSTAVPRQSRKIGPDFFNRISSF